MGRCSYLKCWEDGAYRLLERIGLLDDMSHQDLDRAWSAGLEKWWESLDGADPMRRDLLFHLWGAVSRLASEAGMANDSPSLCPDGQWQVAVRRRGDVLQ